MSAFEEAVGHVRDGDAAEDQARELLGQLTGDEKLGLLDGD